MATYGKAREATIKALRECTPFARKGFAMKGIQGAVTHFGKMDAEDKELYLSEARNNDVMYTVVSYSTPIAWVLRDGTVVMPEAGYSNTTKKHKSLCAGYLAKS